MALAALCNCAHAQEWTLAPAPAFKVEDEGPKAPDGLVDGHQAIADVKGDILSAWYDKPTKRYAHAILGDAVEAARLVVNTSKHGKLTFELPQNQVFEDRTPRLYDFDGFGKIHVITILSDTSEGASIAIFGLVENKLELVTQTPFIGRANRWRNIAGIADFDGDGSTQIAEVVTPHIGGTLNFWRWSKGKLELSAELHGFSNHAIGSREQRLSAMEDFDGDGVTDLALPSGDRRALRIMKFEGAANNQKTLMELANIKLPAPISQAISTTLTDDETGSPVIHLGLSDGTNWSAAGKQKQ